jgi:hypothetical protein
MRRNRLLFVGLALLGAALLVALVGACGGDPAAPFEATAEWVTATATRAWEHVTATPTQSPSPTPDDLIQWWVDSGGVAFPASTATPWAGPIGKIYQCDTTNYNVRCNASFDVQCDVSSSNGTITELQPTGTQYQAYYLCAGDSCEGAGTYPDADFKAHRTELILCLVGSSGPFTASITANQDMQSRRRFLYLRARVFGDTSSTPTAQDDKSGTEGQEKSVSASDSSSWSSSQVLADTKGSYGYGRLTNKTPTPYVENNIIMNVTPLATPTPLPRIYVYVRSPITPGLPLPTVIVPGIGEAWRLNATATPQWLVEDIDVSESDFAVRSTPGIWEGGAILFTATGSTALRVIGITPEPSNVVYTGSLFDDPDKYAALWSYPPTITSQLSVTFVMATPTPTPPPPIGHVQVYEGTSTPLPVNGIGQYKRRADNLLIERLIWEWSTYSASGYIHMNNWISRGVGIDFTGVASNLRLVNIVPVPTAGAGTQQFGTNQAFALWAGEVPTQTQWDATFHFATVTPTPTPTPTPCPTRIRATGTPGPVSVDKRVGRVIVGNVNSPMTGTLRQAGSTYTETCCVPWWTTAGTLQFSRTIDHNAILNLSSYTTTLTRTLDVITLTGSLISAVGVSPTILTGQCAPDETLEARAYRWITPTGTTTMTRQVTNYFTTTCLSSGAYTFTVPLTFTVWPDQWWVRHASVWGDGTPTDVDTLWDIVTPSPTP